MEAAACRQFVMTYLIFDLETTGLSPSSEDIIQIAGIKVRAGQWHQGERFETFVRPTKRVPSFITGLTGIAHHQVAGAPQAPEALRAFSQFAGDATLIAHNGQRFDMPFLRQSCLRYGLPVRPVPFVDSMAFSRKLWGGRGGHGLDAVISRLGLSVEGIRRHDARGDVELLAQAVGKMWHQLTPDVLACPVTVGEGALAAVA